MNKILLDWVYVIKNCSIENTYKIGWCKSIIESCLENKESKEISFTLLSHKMFKYYWNQTVFFNLHQSSNPNKPPLFITYVREKIKEFQINNGKQPIEYERLEGKVDIDFKYLNSILKKDVSHRFLKVSGTSFELYHLDFINQCIILPDPKILHEYSDILFEIINYRWSQILETFNNSPRISKKVKITDRGFIKRKSLNRFHKYLSLNESKCFICNKDLNGDISIDHLIPWSYLYSDDLWNLVYTHTGCNSSKSNKLVNENDITKLENRNIELETILFNNNITDKIFSELKFSNENKLLRKFWIGFKG